MGKLTQSRTVLRMLEHDLHEGPGVGRKVADVEPCLSLRQRHCIHRQPGFMQAAQRRWLDGRIQAVHHQRLAAAAAELWARFSTLDGDTPFSINDGWRSGGEPAPTRVTLRDPEDRLWSFDFDEDEYVDAGALAIIGRDDISVACQGDVWHFEVPDPMRGGHRLGVSTDADVISPMPGTVLRVDVAEGDSVTLGQQLGVVEAMKMELALLAPYDGVVAHVGAAAGDQVPIKHLLFTVDPA